LAWKLAARWRDTGYSGSNMGDATWGLVASGRGDSVARTWEREGSGEWVRG
jgi:hypothetical protein